jgi:hypothetical protein
MSDDAFGTGLIVDHLHADQTLGDTLKISSGDFSKLDTAGLSPAARMDLDLDDGFFEMEVSNNFFNFLAAYRPPQMAGTGTPLGINRSSLA